MAASDFENPRRDERWDERGERGDRDESKAQGTPEDAGRGSYGAASGGRASGSQRYGYAHEPVYRAPVESGRDEPAGLDRPDPSHRFDPDYHEWRAEQMRQLDKDYALWRQERYRKFAEEFETWRRQRFAGEHRPAPGARAGGPSFPPAARSTSTGFRGPTFGSANALGTQDDSSATERGALRPRAERGERPEAADRLQRPEKVERSDLPERSERGADRSDKPDRPEKSGGILSGLLGTGSSRK